MVGGGSGDDSLTDPSVAICFSSYDGKYQDPVALSMYQSTNSLITGLVFGYFTLFITSLLACQMALSADTPQLSGSSNTGSGMMSNTSNPLNRQSEQELPTTKNSTTMKMKRGSKAKRSSKANVPPLIASAKPLGAKPPTGVPPPKSPTKALPANWSEFVHEETGKYYYYNKETKETVWVRPTV